MNFEVSILIAARNEEHNIDDCLFSLINQVTSYNVEILVGDDNSSDLTYEKVSVWANKYPNISLHKINTKIAHLEGKTNVLAQLANKSAGKYLLFTDADTELNKNWVNAMVNSLQNFDMVGGVTITRGNTFLINLQKADLIYLFWVASQLNKMGLPTSACGNNMGIKKEVYDKIGTYENIPYSIVEDYALSKAVRKSGYTLKILLTPNNVAVTKPQITYKEYFHQRNRWMKGALDFPFLMMLLVYLRSVRFFILVLFSFFYFKILISVFCFFWLYSIFSLAKAYRKLKLNLGLEIATYFPVNLVFSFITVCNFIVAKHVIWKDRLYNKL